MPRRGSRRRTGAVYLPTRRGAREETPGSLLAGVDREECESLAPCGPVSVCSRHTCVDEEPSLTRSFGRHGEMPFDNAPLVVVDLPL